jgi:hypothetical protein
MACKKKSKIRDVTSWSRDVEADSAGKKTRKVREKKNWKSDHRTTRSKNGNEGMFKILTTEKRSETVVAHHMRTRNLNQLTELALLLQPLEGIEFFGLLVVIELEAGIAAALKPLGSDSVATANLLLQLLVGGTDLVDGVIGREAVLLEPLIDVLLLFLELADIFDGALQDSALVLVTVWYEAGNLVDSLIDSFTSSALNWKGGQ